MRSRRFFIKTLTFIQTDLRLRRKIRQLKDLLTRRTDTLIAITALVVSIYVIFRDSKKNEADLITAKENQRQDSFQYSQQINLANQLHSEQLKSQKAQTDSLVAELDRIRNLSDKSQEKLDQQVFIQNKQIALLDRQLKLTLGQVSDDEDVGQPQLSITEIMGFRDYRTSYKTMSLRVTIENTGERTALNLSYKVIVIYHSQRDSIFTGKSIKNLPRDQELFEEATFTTPEQDPGIFSVYQHLLPESSYNQNVYFVVLLSYKDTKVGKKLLTYYYRNDNMYPTECSSSEVLKITEYFKKNPKNLKAITSQVSK